MTSGNGRGSVMKVAPALLYVAYIFVMGSVRGADTPMNVSDKTAHFVAFGVAVPLFARALGYFRPTLPNTTSLAVAACASSVAGALLEFWQAFIPWRSSDVWDWVADTLGAASAFLLIVAFRAAKLGAPSAR